MSIATDSALPGERLGRGRRLLQRLGPAPAADHGRPEPRELERGLAAQPAAGPGDHADPSVEQSGRKDSRALRRHGARRLYGYSGPAMKVRAETKPLRAPLAGGREGATVVVEPILTGTMESPRAFLESASAFPTLRMLGVGTPRSS